MGACCGSTVAPRAAAPQDTRLTRSAVWLRAGEPCLECRGPVEMAHQSSATGRHLPGSQAELARGHRAGREAAHVRTDGWGPRGSARRGTGRSPGHLVSNPPGTTGRWALWPLTAQGLEKLGTTLQGFGHKVPRGGCTRPPGSLEQELDLARPFETPAAHNPKARLLHRRPEWTHSQETPSLAGGRGRRGTRRDASAPSQDTAPLRVRSPYHLAQVRAQTRRRRAQA